MGGQPRGTLVTQERPYESPSPSAMLGTQPLLDLGRFVPGTMLGQRYRIAGRLGKGGMGEVYRADDLKLGQSVAMKFLPEELSQDMVSLTRLINEVKIARSVSHPNVCRVYDIGDIDGLNFISMEYVDGEDLGTLLRRIGRLPVDKAVQIARQLCAGMAAAHEKGVLHRDLKPANIMIDGRGAVRIMDFGLAGLAAELAKEGSRAGTPAYMAPEQLQAKGVTPRSDIYALGLVLYEMFTGKPVYRPQSMAELTQLHERPVASMSTIVPEIPETVDRAVMRCLEREPMARHSSVAGFAAALGGVDPLAAAIAAGEIPSPELVAASGGQGTLPMTLAASVLGVLLVGLLVVAGLNPLVRLYETDRPKNPDVMVERAQAVLSTVKAGLPGGDSAYGYTEERFAPTTTSDQQTQTPTAAMRFWYRQSPTALVPRVADQPLSQTEPPADQPGMNLVVLDSAGRLVKLEVLPAAMKEAPKSEGAQTPPAVVEPTDWKPLLEAAGVPKDGVEKVTPIHTPRVAADSRVAWQWKDDKSGSTVRCEAALLGARPVSFQVYSNGPSASTDTSAPGDQIAAFLSGTLLLVLIYGAPLALALYNLRLGRGDRRGAMRLAAAILTMSVVAWLFKTRLTPDPILLLLFPKALADGLHSAALLWLLYIGIEPFIRQAWPQALISWSRLLAGEFKDGLVGRDLLFGTAIGVVWTIIGQVLYAWGGTGPRPLPRPIDYQTLAGIKVAAGELLDSGRAAVLWPLVILLVVPLVRAVAKKLIPVNAVVFAALLIVSAIVLMSQTGRSEDSVGLGIAAMVAILIAAGGTYVMSRFGALMIMTAFFTAGVLASFPLTLSLGDRFYTGPAVLAFATIAGLALFGFRNTTARRAMPAGWNI
ncbi:MAG: serine/threonine-protein kinase [Planctomycetota bacterium]